MTQTLEQRHAAHERELEERVAAMDELCRELRALAERGTYTGKIVLHVKEGLVGAGDVNRKTGPEQGWPFE